MRRIRTGAAKGREFSGVKGEEIWEEEERFILILEEYYLTNSHNEGNVSKDHVKSSTKGLFLITSHVDFELQLLQF